MSSHMNTNLTSPRAIGTQPRIPSAPPLEDSNYSLHTSDPKDDTAIGNPRHIDDKSIHQEGIYNRKHGNYPTSSAPTAAATAAPIMGHTNIDKNNHNTITSNSVPVATPYSEDLYARDRAHSKFKYLYYRFVNPWIRWLIAFPLLYIYALFSGILTYRHNTYRDYLMGLVPPTTHPLTLPDGTQPFVLRDLMHDLFPAREGAELDRWISFADATPVIWIVLCVVMMLVRRDVIRITEFIVIELILFTLNAVAHVLTTYPDAHGYQYSCIKPEYQTWGDWVFQTVTTSYCGDMMWSGHTQNTLIPLIMMRRMLFDFLGWNISWGVRDSISQKFHQPQLHSGHYDNDTERNNHFMDYIRHTNNFKGDYGAKTTSSVVSAPASKTNSAASLQGDDRTNGYSSPVLTGHDIRKTDAAGIKEQIAAENDSFQYRSATETRIAEQSIEPQYSYAREHAAYPVSAMDTAPNTGNALAEQRALKDEIALRAHENHDIHINIHAATLVPPNMPENRDHDMFFFKQISPYTSPNFVQQHRRLFFVLQLVLRIIFASWFIALIITLMLIRYHYSTDVYISMLVCSLVATNTHLVQTLVRCLYRPYYHNYLYKSWWRPVYLRWPLNDEQVNYEERMRRVAVGGLF